MAFYSFGVHVYNNNICIMFVAECGRKQDGSHWLIAVINLVCNKTGIKWMSESLLRLQEATGPTRRKSHIESVICNSLRKNRLDGECYNEWEIYNERVRKWADEEKEVGVLLRAIIKTLTLEASWLTHQWCLLKSWIMPKATRANTEQDPFIRLHELIKKKDIQQSH